MFEKHFEKKLENLKYLKTFLKNKLKILKKVQKNYRNS